MPSPFQAAGATIDQSKSAPLHTNRFFTGLWTQRSPLRDAATPFLYEKFYSASRYDSLIGGLNTEITTRLTLARRPGHSIWFGAISLNWTRWAAFRAYVNAAEVIYVMADTQASAQSANGLVVAIGGGLNALGYSVLAVKSTTARVTFFCPVGNTCYFCDEVESKKWLISPVTWAPATTIAPGTFIVTNAGTSLQYTENGGVTGFTQPSWVAGVNETYPVDGTVLWVSRGPAVQNWGIAAPTAAPAVAQVSASSSGVGWTANSYYRPAPYAIDTASNTAQQLTKGGVTASSVPSFSATPGNVTNDGAAQWTSLGSAQWFPNAGKAENAIVLITFGPGNEYTSMFQALNPGITGAAQPSWPPGTNSVVQDGTVVWQNIGLSYTTSANSRGTNNIVSSQIIDPKGGAQNCISPGISNPSTAPNFAEVVGQTTDDAGAVWSCIAIPPNTTAQWTYAYAFKNTITGNFSTASPLSVQGVPAPGNVLLITGIGSADTQVDMVRLYRTLQGQSTLFFLADIPCQGFPPSGISWMFYDDVPDEGLNPLIQAQIADTNDPPPATISAPVYYLDRIWAFNGNVLQYSGGPDTLQGNGNEAWPPANSFTYPSRGLRLWPTNVGLLVFTQSDVYVVQGTGTASNPFFSTNFQEGVGLLNYDAFAVNGSTAYLMTSASRLIAFDPGAGETEVGFPIGDLLASYAQYGAHLAYHEGSSADTALYAADGQVGWYRLSTISAPEQGQVWSPQAVLQPGVDQSGNGYAGVGYVQSIEVSPGVKRLLVAPLGTGPILMRDDTVSADNTVPYPANATIGSIVLAQPGQISGIEFVTVDSTIAGSKATLGMLFGEISGTFTNLTPTRQDPTLLPPSTTIRGDRYYLPQVGKPAWCRHMQLKISWPTEAAPNEMLAYTLFGEIKQERPEG